MNAFHTVVLQKIKQYFTARFVGAMSVGFIGYWITKKIGLSAIGQGLLLVGILMLIGVFYLYRHYRQNISSKLLELGIKQHKATTTLAKVHDEYLKTRMNEAIRALKTSSLGGNKWGKRALYVLPWYVVIGPPSNGKSTLLRNSSLNFPFAIDKDEDYKIKGIGGTRNCDWWFSDKAIFLDTAGRYTQSNNVSDQQEWYSFLNVLKRARPKAPLNGIVVTLGLTDIMTAEDGNFRHHVASIATRIRELYDQLGYLIPVYLVFTKIDRLTGFDSFFKNLQPQEQQQLWGVNLTDVHQASEVGVNLQERFSQLFQQLLHLSLSKIAIEKEPQEKETIFDFPYQFQAALSRIEAFIRSLAEVNPYQEAFRLMGAYFVSSTQADGDYVRKAIGEIEKTNSPFLLFPREKEKSSSKSFFVNKFFHEVLFKTSVSFCRNKKKTLLLRWVQAGSVVGGCIIVALTFLLFSTSLTLNTSLIQEGEKTLIATVDNIQRPALDNVRLETLRNAVTFLNRLQRYQKNTPFYLRMGLYRGAYQLNAYAALVEQMLPKSVEVPIKEALERRLMLLGQLWEQSSTKSHMRIRGEYYTTLKAYMMLAFPTYLEPAFASRVITPLWYKQVFKQHKDALEQSWPAYENVIHYYLLTVKHNEQAVKRWQINTALVSKARRQLNSPTNANNLYALIRARGFEELGSDSINQLLNDYGLDLLHSEQKIQQFYTYEGWQNHVLPHINAVVQTASETDWVIDVPLHQLKQGKQYKRINAALAQKYRNQMLEIYFSEYAEAWLKFLASIKVQQFASLDDAAAQYRILYNADGPFAQLFSKITHHLLITKTNEFSSVSPHVQLVFRALHILSQAQGDFLKAYFKELAALQSDIERLSVSADVSRDALAYAQRVLTQADNDTELHRAAVLVDRLLGSVESASARRLLKPLLLSAIREAWRVILLEGRRGLAQKWQDNVFRIYQTELQAKFPFTASGEEVAESDFIEFFSPKDGLFWSFVHQQLAAFIEYQNNQYHDKRWLDIGIGFNPQFLQTVGYAKRITDGLFHGGKFGFTFYVYPVPTQGVKEILFELGNKFFRYHNGPQEWVRFAWPTHETINGALLRVLPVGYQGPYALEAANQWGLFHLLKKARLTPFSSSKFKASWLLGTNKQKYPIVFYFKGEGRNSPLNTLLLEQHTFPKMIFNTHA